MGLLPAVADALTGVGSWNFKQARITDTARAQGNKGAGVVVAVVDTWVDRYPTEFGTRVRRGADCLGGTCRAVRATADHCGHGTHVAGIIGSHTYGVAPRVSILPVRVLRWDKSKQACTGTTTDVAHGIRWAANHGADIINLSLAPESGGITITTQVTAAVQYAISAGKVVVFAAGNNRHAVADDYGGRALIVAATGPKGALAPYSQRGQGVSIAAPGGNPGSGQCLPSNCIASTWAFRTSSGTIKREGALLAGTSMAAAHVSGVAALLISEHPTRSARNVVHAIKSTARPLAGAGAGRINAAAALALHPPSTSTTTVTNTRRSALKTTAVGKTRSTSRNSLGAADASRAAVGKHVALRHHPDVRRTAARARIAAGLGTDDPLPSLPVGVALGVLVCYAVAVVGLTLGVPFGGARSR